MAEAVHAHRSRFWINNLTAGLVIGLFISVLAVSLASLLFAGTLQASLATGIGVVLLTSAVHAIALALVSLPGGMFARAQDSPAVVIAASIAAIAATAGGINLATALVLISASTIAAGGFLFLLAQFRLGDLGRYLPYPVIGGFLAGTGALLLIGALGVMTSMSLGMGTVAGYLHADQVLLWLPGLVYGVVMFFAARRLPHLFTLPLLLLAGVLLFYLALLLTGTSIAQATALGLVFGQFDTAAVWAPLVLAESFGTIDWAALAGQSGNLLSIFAITSITALLNISGIEVALGEDLDLNRELRTLGLLNMATGVLGGAIGFHSVSMSALSSSMRARNRAVGLIAGIVPLLVLLFGSRVLGLVPVPLLGALLVFLGLNLGYSWLVDHRRSFVLAEYVVVLAIAAVIVTLGFLPGVVFGFLVMVVLFLVTYSQIDIFHQVVSGADVASRVQRNAYVQRELARLGRQTHVLRLRGYVFFGTANKILDALIARLRDDSAPLSFFVLDFSRVARIDSSAAFSFNRLLNRAASQQFSLVLVAMSPVVERNLADMGILASPHLRVFSDLDRALEWAEDELIARDALAQRLAPATLESQLAVRGFGPDHTARLKPYLAQVQLAQGELLIGQGDPADDMYFIEHGQVTVWVQVDDETAIRVQSLASGTLVGEVGFMLNVPRTANVSAKTDTLAWRLDRAALATMQASDPDLAFALNELVLGVTAERVASSTREIAAMSR